MTPFFKSRQSPAGRPVAGTARLPRPAAAAGAAAALALGAAVAGATTYGVCVDTPAGSNDRGPHCTGFPCEEYKKFCDGTEYHWSKGDEARFDRCEYRSNVNTACDTGGGDRSCLRIRFYLTEDHCVDDIHRACSVDNKVSLCSTITVGDPGGPGGF